MKLDVSGGGSQGARAYQEDCFDICSEASGQQDSCLMVLCDGMGGHQGGALASRTATDAFVENFLAAPQTPAPDQALQTALDAAHRALITAVDEHDAPADMGTTLVAAYFSGRDLHWISVGDSHLYLYRNGGLNKLNEDHSMASVLDELVEIGRLSTEEAASDPQRGALRSSLSHDEIHLVDRKSKPAFLNPGDTLLLASDGLDTLDTQAITHVLAREHRNGAADTVARLLQDVEACQNPLQDNVTVVVATLGKVSMLARLFCI